MRRGWGSCERKLYGLLDQRRAPVLMPDYRAATINTEKARMNMVRSCLAVGLVAVLCAGCASTDVAQVRTKEKRLAEFNSSVRDYRRMQYQQKLVEQRSEGEKVMEESRGIPAPSRQAPAKP